MTNAPMLTPLILRRNLLTLIATYQSQRGDSVVNRCIAILLTKFVDAVERVGDVRAGAAAAIKLGELLKDVHGSDRADKENQLRKDLSRVADILAEPRSLPEDPSWTVTFGGPAASRRSVPGKEGAYYLTLERAEYDPSRSIVASIQLPPETATELADVAARYIPGLVLALLVDRDETGLWGYSLVYAAAAYGHDDADVGSITISKRALDALVAVSASELWGGEADALSAALAERRERGGVGMRRGPSSFTGATTLVPDPRHTAAAVQWWAPRTLDYLIEGVGFLRATQHDRRGWGAGEIGDPLTTAYVYRSLRTIDDAGLLQKIAGAQTFCKEYEAAALQTLFDLLGRDDGWWLLRTAKTQDVPSARHPRVHNFTADVAATAPEFAYWSEPFALAYARVLARLDAAWVGSGIPADGHADTPDLGTTVLYVHACWATRHLDRGRSDHAVRRLLASLEELVTDGGSDAVADPVNP